MRQLTVVLVPLLAAGVFFTSGAQGGDRRKPDAGSPRAADGGPAQSLDACLDQWAAEQHLNRYGDPPDTVYAGGTPLVDETTGRAKDRSTYIFAKHADAKARCTGK
jgi:hypothetical protein